MVWPPIDCLSTLPVPAEGVRRQSVRVADALPREGPVARGRLFSVLTPKRGGRQPGVLCRPWLASPAAAGYCRITSEVVIYTFNVAGYLLGISIYFSPP